MWSIGSPFAPVIPAALIASWIACVNCVSRTVFVAVTAIDASLGLIRWSPWWAVVSVLFLSERIVTVWRVGTRRGRLLAIAVLPEIFYDLFLQATFVRAGVHILRRSEAHWAHGSGSLHTAHRTSTATSH